MLDSFWYRRRLRFFVLGLRCTHGLQIAIQSHRHPPMTTNWLYDTGIKGNYMGRVVVWTSIEPM